MYGFWRETKVISTAVCMGFPGDVSGKGPACQRRLGVRDASSIPRSGRSPEEGNGSPCRLLTWRVPWTEEPGGLQSTGSCTTGHDWSALAQPGYLSSYLLLYALNDNATTLHTSRECDFTAFYVCEGSGRPPLWHQELVLGKTTFPWTEGEGHGFGKIQALTVCLIN